MNPVVIKLSGKTLDDPARAELLWKAVASASRVMPIVIVHGGGKQVDALLERLGETTTRIDGIRVTPKAQMGPIAGVLAGQVSLQLVGALQAQQAPAVGLALGSSGVLGCQMADERLGRVGEPVQREPALITTLLSSGYLPVVNSIGLDEQGEMLNVNADDAATALAIALEASELVYISDVAGLLDASGEVVTSVTQDQIDHLIAENVIRDGMIAKVRSASRALQSGVGRVRITDSTGAMGCLRGEAFIATTIKRERAATE